MQKATDKKKAAAAATQKAKVDDDKLKARAIGGTQLQDKEASGNQENGGEQENGETVKIEDATTEQEKGGGVAGGGHAFDSAKAAEAAVWRLRSNVESSMRMRDARMGRRGQKEI